MNEADKIKLHAIKADDIVSWENHDGKRCRGVVNGFLTDAETRKPYVLVAGCGRIELGRVTLRQRNTPWGAEFFSFAEDPERSSVATLEEEK